MIEYIIKTLSLVDWSFSSYLFGPIGLILGYSLGLRAKKKDLLMSIIDEIRGATEEYVSTMIEANNRKECFINNPQELKEKVDKILIRNSHKISLLKRIKIKHVINKITKIVKLISEDEKPTNDKYRGIFYKYLNSISIYD